MLRPLSLLAILGIVLLNNLLEQYFLFVCFMLTTYTHMGKYQITIIQKKYNLRY